MKNSSTSDEKSHPPFRGGISSHRLSGTSFSVLIFLEKIMGEYQERKFMVELFSPNTPTG
ncbi:hypothetical protein CJJ19_09230 [Candidatus Williamhamiltonella defendens]|nr:hypothetical protein CJJ19_09230 [Candidatus Hamiltonella defensa]